MVLNKKLLDLIKNQFALPLNLLHGLPHWKRVEALGRRLATSTKADPKVITLFAYLHDSCRENEDFDPEHGLRASLFVKRLYTEKVLKITPRQLKDLITACEFHSDKNAKPDKATIATCWDADRLDLRRLGISPNQKYLFTDVARSKAEEKTNRVANR